MLLLLALACSTQPATTPTVTWPDSDWQDPGVATPPADEDPVEDAAPLVMINELQASNDSTVEDDHGDEDDWVELVSCTDAAVDLSGWGLSDDADDGPRWTVPAGTVLEPGARLVLWLDDETDEGPLHLPFKLSSGSEQVLLYDPDGTVVDQVATTNLGTDTVYGRFPDCGALWAESLVATPGQSNPWDPGWELDPTTQLFPDDEVLTIELLVDEAGQEALASDPYEYVQGSVTFRGVTLQPVGVRIKGQWGSYRTLDGKSAFKVHMGAFGGDQKLRGLEKLTLNNMVQDASLIHERIAYRLFRDMGVPTPRTAHVAVYLNGEYRGLYLNVESPDELFLARWFDNDEGNLYEGAYGQDVDGDNYLELEVDEPGSDDPDDFSDLAALSALLAQEPSEDLVPQLEALIDVDEWMAALAVEVIIGHWDGYFWYPNNYRIYHDPSTDQISLLPWGVDQTFDYDGDILSASGAVAAWCLEIPSVQARYKLALWEAADRMEALELDVDALEAHAMVLPWFAASEYEEYSSASSRSSLNSTLDFLAERPEGILEQLFPDGPP